MLSVNSITMALESDLVKSRILYLLEMSGKTDIKLCTYNFHSALTTLNNSY